MMFLDSNENVLQWASESISIPYRNPLTGKQSIYVPDFLVTYRGPNNTTKAELIEIKPAAHQIILSGNARVEDRDGRVGIPAESLTFDTVTHNWRMDSVRSKTGSPVRPKILLPDAGFTLPLPQ